MKPNKSVMLVRFEHKKNHSRDQAEHIRQSCGHIRSEPACPCLRGNSCWLGRGSPRCDCNRLCRTGRPAAPRAESCSLCYCYTTICTERHCHTPLTIRNLCVIP